MTKLDSGRTRIVLALGGAQTLAWGSTYYLPAILAVPMAESMGTTTGPVFGAFSAALVLSALLGPVAGRRIDGFGGRDVLAASSLVFAIGLATLGAAQSLWMLYVGWLILGIGMAMGLYEAAFATLTGIYGSTARGSITGITLLAGLASTICWPITAVMEAEMGWRMACFAWAAIHIVIGLPVNRFLIPKGTQPVDTVAAKAQDGGRKSVPSAQPPLWDRAMVLLAVAFTATWFISTAMAAHLPRMLQESGATAATAIAIAALVGPAQVAGRLLEFGILQRFHPLLSARLAGAAHPLGVITLIIAGPVAAPVFALLHGAGNGILTIAKGTLPLALFGPAGYGRRQGLLSMPARFGQAAAPFLFALLIDRYGSSALLFSAAIGMAGATALCLLTARSPSQTPSRADP